MVVKLKKVLFSICRPLLVFFRFQKQLLTTYGGQIEKSFFFCCCCCCCCCCYFGFQAFLGADPKNAFPSAKNAPPSAPNMERPSAEERKHMHMHMFWLSISGHNLSFWMKNNSENLEMLLTWGGLGGRQTPPGFGDRV